VDGSKPASSRLCYKGTPRASLWRLPRPVSLVVLLLSLPAGGCSFSYQLGNLFDKDEPEHTGSLASQRRPPPTKPAALPPDTDLAYARAAAANLLAKEGETRSAPWENPHSGARGTVSPLAAAYTQDGVICRDFLASYLRPGEESWLQGEACRADHGKWEVRTLRPWKRT
jgi:hypothetical protein